MSITCNQPLTDVFSLLQDGGVWINPQADLISGLGSATHDKVFAVDLAIEDLDPMSEDYAERLAALEQLRTTLVLVSGDPLESEVLGNSPLGRAAEYTSFMSGNMATFPAATLGDWYTSVPNGAYLATLGFAGFLGIVSAAPSLNQELCQFDPEDPCADLLGMFGMVLGTFAAGFAALQSILDSLVDLLSVALSVITDAITGLVQFVADLQAKIIQELTKLAGLVSMAIFYGLSKLLQALKLDPCAVQILGAITTPEAQQVLGIITP